MKPRTCLSFCKWRQEDGATAVEYGIMLAAIAAVILTVVFAMGGQLSALFESFQLEFDAALGD